MCISLIFSNFVVSKHKVIIFHAMHNLYANFAKILEICKDFSKNLVNELGNIPRLLSTGNCKIINLSEETILWGFKI